MNNKVSTQKEYKFIMLHIIEKSDVHPEHCMYIYEAVKLYKTAALYIYLFMYLNVQSLIEKKKKLYAVKYFVYKRW